MKKLIQYLKQIDPRITVEVNVEGTMYSVSASIKNEFSLAARSTSLRKAKKQFFKGPVAIVLAKDVADLRVNEALVKREQLIREQEEMLEREFESLWTSTADFTAETLIEMLTQSNELIEIKSTFDHLRGLK